jgi:hypothetical protein
VKAVCVLPWMRPLSAAKDCPSSKMFQPRHEPARSRFQARKIAPSLRSHDHDSYIWHILLPKEILLSDGKS